MIENLENTGPEKPNQNKMKKLFLFVFCGLIIFVQVYIGAKFYSYAQEEHRVNAKKENVAKALDTAETTVSVKDVNNDSSSDVGVLNAEKSKKASDDVLIEVENTASDDSDWGNIAIAEAAVWNEPVVAKDGQEPLVVNGDTVEYAGTKNEVSASGNVEIDYKGSKLSCQSLKVNTLSKEGFAEGNVKIEDKDALIVGDKVSYNFATQSGIIDEATFRSSPYFGKATRIEKAGPNQFIALNAKVSTCNFDHPHYRMGAKEVNIYPKNKIQIKGADFFVSKFPILYIPQFNQSLKDPLMHVQVMPGSRKDWGAYMLSDWRYNLTDNVNGNLYLDYRQKLGLAEGVGLNYKNQAFGKGDYKFYFTDETPSSVPDGKQKSYERYLSRWRHQWAIDEQTNFTSEFYKIKDEARKILDPNKNILKDFFFREYEKDSQPLTYALFHHSFPSASLDLLMQKNINHWYNQLDKLPELSFTLPSYQIGDSMFYFENNSTLSNLSKGPDVSPTSPEKVSFTRLDTTNKFSLPVKIAIFDFTPFVGSRETIYDRGLDGTSLPARTIFTAGSGLSTKFYRNFDITTRFLGMEINELRHVLSPIVDYTYNHTPTIPESDLRQIDSVDALTSSNTASFGLANKLQTKRNGISVDLIDFRVTSAYNFSPQVSSTYKGGGGLSDLFFRLKALPYSWLRFESDATFNNRENSFTDVNYDFSFDLGKERSFGLGQRYQRSGGNQITESFNWRLTPKWKFSTYHRFNIKGGPDSTNGLQEQQYTFTRDLHCWLMDVTFRTTKNEGSTVYFMFRLKAFPETAFGFNQSYQSPESGSQSNP